MHYGLNALEHLLAVVRCPKLCAYAVQYTASHLRTKRSGAVHHATVIRNGNVAIAVPAQVSEGVTGQHTRLYGKNAIWLPKIWLGWGILVLPKVRPARVNRR